VTAEEKGELGSLYFALRPTVPFPQIVADINLDMFLPLYALKVIEVQGLAESSLGDSVRAAAKTLGVDVQTDREPEQNRFIRSDQYSFIRAGIPALAMKVGFELNTPEAAIAQKWTAERYHLPSDDLNQPVDRDAADSATDGRTGCSVMGRVAVAAAPAQGGTAGRGEKPMTRNVLGASDERRSWTMLYNRLAAVNYALAPMPEPTITTDTFIPTVWGAPLE